MRDLSTVINLDTKSKIVEIPISFGVHCLYFIRPFVHSVLSYVHNSIQLMHSFEVNIGICQGKGRGPIDSNSDVC